MTIQTAPPGAAPPGSAEAAGQARHVTPWHNCHCSTHLLGGESQFVMSAEPGNHWLPGWLPKLKPKNPSDQSGRRDFNPRPLDPQS